VSDKILVFIPCYNCAPQIPRVIEKCLRVENAYISEIIVIDNGSTDDTVAAAEAALSQQQQIPWKVLRNSQNYSLGGSHKVAFAYALRQQFTHVIAIHGDDQADIGDLAPWVRAGRHREVDALLGSRFVSGARLHGYGRFRRFGNFVFNALFSAFSGRIVKDMGSGLNLYSRKVLEAGDHRKAADDLTFHCFFLLRMLKNQRNLFYFPIQWFESDQASNAKLFRQAWKILKLLIAYRMSSGRIVEVDHGNAAFSYSYVVMAEGAAR
jgi:glycosyltransferase involved in cell wall biosynthesis